MTSPGEPAPDAAEARTPGEDEELTEATAEVARYRGLVEREGDEHRPAWRRP